MRPFKRLPVIDFLAENWEKWGKEYAVRKMADSSFQFNWYKPGYPYMNRQIIPRLREQTDKHCSYCDFYLPRLADTTIDHFKPKGKEAYYKFAYQWENLYACCGHCQKAKREKFDEALLRPDDPTYSFERYFMFKFATGEIQPNPTASEPDLHRAKVTIELLNINEEEQKLLRKQKWEFYQTQSSGDLLNDYPFRFIFE